jgi:4-hydroxybenzoate polyprenyltransferase
MQIPLVVDFDGTLVRTDALHESLVQNLFRHPFRFARAILNLPRGKAAFKAVLAESYLFEAADLPYVTAVIEEIEKARSAKRRVVLASASNSKIVNRVAEYLGTFDEVIGSEEHNLGGANKAEVLNARYGSKGYDYIGNSPADLAVWQHAKTAFVVSKKKSLIAKLQSQHTQVVVLPDPPKRIIWLRQLRVHQWLKNLLLGAPMAASFAASGIDNLDKLVLGFFSFSFIASSVYLMNDLLDLENDRAHHSKRERPLASGRISLLSGLATAILLMPLGLVMASFVGPGFLLITMIYLATTFAYSFWLKKAVIIDCLVLAFLYTIRVIAGALAVDLSVTFWLLAVSVFMFLSLAWVKRYAELNKALSLGATEAKGRGYRVSDLPMLGFFGVASGFMGVLVFTLYIDSNSSEQIYRTPELAWFAIPVLVYWISRIWLKAYRGEMNEDPMVFAFKDRASLASAALLGLVLYVAYLGVSF